MTVPDPRKRYLIAQALWEFVANERKKPSIRQQTSNMYDMEEILDKEYADIVPMLIASEKHRQRIDE